jgi:rhodanese-related sulfurtransferase
LRTARITVDELRQKQKAGDEVVIIDLRPGEDLTLDPYLIPGAIHLAVEEVEHRHHEIPRDREVIVYCSCPNEVSSARVALRLQRQGITSVRPLLGGLDAWRELNYPVEAVTRPPKSLPALAPLPVDDKSSSRANLDKAA